MILAGIDDTDILDARGTNKLARALVEELAPRWRCVRILRHQLLVDPRVPYTSHNGSASLLFEGEGPDGLFAALRAGMLADFIVGSDPGLCVVETVTAAVREFGETCRREVVTQGDALALAAAHGIRLEPLGGTGDGVVGALAAVGLAAGGDHGRVIHADGVPDLVGPQPAAAVLAAGVDALLPEGGGAPVLAGTVDVGKHLRPNRRGGRTVLFVEPGEEPGTWRALRRD